MISAERLREIQHRAGICKNEFGADVRFDECTAGELIELVARAQGLSQEDRAALDAGSTALQEGGEFHIYKDGKVYTRHECSEMAAILRRLGGQTT